MSGAARPIRLLEIRSVRGTGGGPEKTILMSAARSDPDRVQTTVCYIRDARDGVFGVDRRASDLGVDYVEVSERHSFDVSAWARLRRVIRDRRIDIVHAHEYKTDLLAWWLSRVEDVVPLSTVHGWSGHSWRERAIYYPADRRLLRAFPRVIAVSSEIRERLVRAGVRRSRIALVLNAIDHRAFARTRSIEPEARRALGLGPHDFVIGTVARLEDGKGLDMLIDVVSSLQARRPDIRLVIAGDGSRRAHLEARARERFPPGGWRFLGHRPDVAFLHHAFDLFVHPSDHEGTPNAVLEAMALETPLIATDAGGTAELARDGVHGRIVPCRDARALSDAIACVLANPAAAASRAAAARRRAETALSFDTRMHTVESIYGDLLKRVRRTGAGAGIA